jgi:hypothetical protein
MAQLGARLNGIEKVVGSNPTGSTLHFTTKCLELPKPGYLENTRAGVVGHLPES